MRNHHSAPALYISSGPTLRWTLARPRPGAKRISEAIGRVRFRDLISAARSTLEQRIGSPEVSKAAAGKPTRWRSDYDAAGASTRNSTESSVFGESGFASNKAQRLNCPCRLEGSSFRLRSQKLACEAENFACETLSFRASARKNLKSLVAKRSQNPSRFAVKLRSFLIRSFLREVSVRLMGATFDLYLSGKIKLSRFSFSENRTPSEDCGEARYS